MNRILADDMFLPGETMNRILADNRSLPAESMNRILVSLLSLTLACVQAGAALKHQLPHICQASQVMKERKVGLIYPIFMAITSCITKFIVPHFLPSSPPFVFPSSW
eukprot:scpid97496/ scgid4001/ 